MRRINRNCCISLELFSLQLNMFRAFILPILRSTRLCVKACGIMHPRCCRPVVWKRRNSASRLPAGIAMGALLINRYCCIKLVVYIIYINDTRSRKYHTFICRLVRESNSSPSFSLVHLLNSNEFRTAVTDMTSRRKNISCVACTIWRHQLAA